MQPPSERPTFSDYLRIQEAARYLGVCANTLRAWDSQGKLRAKRHPLNGYRLYERGELDKLLETLGDAAAGRQHDGAV